MISVNDITCIMVMENDRGLAVDGVSSVVKFSAGARILVCNNGNSYDSASRIAQLPNVRIIDNQINSSVTNTSVRHGIGINRLYKEVKTNYVAIIESDVLVTSSNWYKLDVDKFDIKAIPRGGNKDIPHWHVCFLLGKTKLFNGINWEAKVRVSEDGKRLYGDTGWEMYKVLKDQSRIKACEQVACSTGNTRYFDKSFSYKSFEIWEDNNPIAAHYFRGSDPSRRKVKYGNVHQELSRWRQTVKKLLGE
jgi:hypothetical protein